MKKILLITLLFLVCRQTLMAQVLINEVCPANISIVKNSNGEFDDYIELYNQNANSINLEGYRLSDVPDSTSGIYFPNFLLNPFSRMLIFAAGSEAAPLINHYEMAVNGRDVWKYSIDSADVNPHWREPNYDDSHWNTGNGGIGYGDGDDATTTPVCLSIKMRYTFTIPDTTNILESILMMDFDDGFSAYLNGILIASKNMWPGENDWNVFATDVHEALMYQGLEPDSFYINQDIFRAAIREGKNVLAIQVHNVEPNSSDLSSIPFLIFGVKDSSYYFSQTPSWFHAPGTSVLNADFKLGRHGETVYLFDASNSIIDQLVYPALESDHCYQRSSDGASGWCISDTPTPLGANDPNHCFLGYTQDPLFSIPGGFYPASNSLSLTTAQQSANIYYTTDGSVPDNSGILYTGPITIANTEVIRARTYANGYLPGKHIANTYFINEESRLPVFSLSTDSLNLWDENSGIYVLGPNADSLWPHLGANYWQDWKKPVSLEYFNKSNQKVLDFNAEIEIYGNYSRTEAQKSFEIQLSDKFGTGSINYPLISDKPFISKYENIVIRNSGTDWNVVHFRDALMEKIMKPTNSGYLAAESIRLFLNGKDWGVYNVHEKNNHKWVELNFGLKHDEYSFLSEQGSKISVERGSDEDFWELFNYATTQSPLGEEYYNEINSQLDLKNYADYFIAETYFNNGDWIGEWTNNIKMWKQNSPGSKWKYLLLDLDFGLGLFGNLQEDRLEMARNPMAYSNSSEIFDAVLENPTFKKYFINRYADLINTIYQPINIKSVMHSFKDSMAFDMVAHFNKWGGDTTVWNTNINNMIQYASQRPSAMRSYIKNQFNLAGQVTLTINTVPPGSGRVEINTITPLTYPWNGVYFNGNPVTLTAIANPGFTFDHWSSAFISASNTIDRINKNFTTNDVIDVHFTGSPEDPLLSLSEINYQSAENFDCEDWIELHNFGSVTLDISGWKISDDSENNLYTLPTGTKILPDGYLVIAEDTNAFDAMYPKTLNRIGPLSFSLKNSGESINIYDHKGNLHLSINYQSIPPWPIEAAGNGYTCEIQDHLGNLNDGSNWKSGCFGGSPGTAHTSALTLSIPVIGDKSFCAGTSTFLSTQEIAGSSYYWSLNENVIPGSETFSYTTNLQGAFKVHLDNQGCTGSSEATMITEVPISKEPLVSLGKRCNPGHVVLRATANDSVYWYDTVGGNIIASGEKFVTKEISQSTQYYARSGNQCPSKFVTAFAIISDGCESELSVYPNPSSNESIYFLLEKNPEPGKMNLKITDSFGRTIEHRVIDLIENQTSVELNADNLPQGIYFIGLEQGDNYYSTKFVRL